MVQDNSSIQAGRRMLRPCFGFRPAVLEFYGWKICKIRNPTRYLVQFTTSESAIRPSFKVFHTSLRNKILPFDNSQIFVNLSRRRRIIGIRMCFFIPAFHSDTLHNHI